MPLYIRHARNHQIFVQIMEKRWKLFGYALRRDDAIQSNKAMDFYFTDNTRKMRRRPLTTSSVIPKR